MYTHIPAIDANFRLKCHVVSNNAHDYSLMLGYEYFIKDALYCKYILNYADQEDISVKFISIWPTDYTQISTYTSFTSKRYATTDVKLILYIQYRFILSNDVGDVRR